VTTCSQFPIFSLFFRGRKKKGGEVHPLPSSLPLWEEEGPDRFRMITISFFLRGKRGEREAQVSHAWPPRSWARTREKEERTHALRRDAASLSRLLPFPKKKRKKKKEEWGPSRREAATLGSKRKERREGNRAARKLACSGRKKLAGRAQLVAGVRLTERKKGEERKNRQTATIRPASSRTGMLQKKKERRVADSPKKPYLSSIPERKREASPFASPLSIPKKRKKEPLQAYVCSTLSLSSWEKKRGGIRAQ